MTQQEMLERMEFFLYGKHAWKFESDAQLAQSGYRIVPTQQVNILFAAGKELVASTARWWLVPRWFKGALRDWKATTFNAKLETAAEKPSFRDAWKNGRCVVPALGYYEWSGPKTNRQPHFIYLQQNQPLLLLAGLQTQRPDGLRTCTILTRGAFPEIADIHDRMPVMLTAQEAEGWLTYSDDDETVKQNLGLAVEGRVKSHRVGKFKRGEDGPELIESIEGFL